MTSQTFDASRAILKGPDTFKRFRVPDKGTPLQSEKLKPETELLIAERNGERRAFVMQELSEPHVAQGILGGEPFMVSF